MKPTTLDKTVNLVSRSMTNYPTVSLEILKELKIQLFNTLQSVLNLLRLFLKTLGILTCPLWILVLAFAFFVIVRLIDNQTIQVST
ncbi:hypothetical protein K5F27_16835 [Acinetobacter baumannii]|uniref:hypothetical protein n=1 Tax=Acinetobacter baumannii TaxID=470 RepID=UPI001FF20626|nr:hypothetical protein [Acinetobacter baumannii]MCJ9118990.1 hypothetical protein [Acinetobacter baumannii]MCJ9181352.1 hypothetical protein [Acinetobacter baumannii]MCJ9185084.1 hypothetical protein [Acinetobacter baumannii]MCJ9192324.1 hypothetical protein [Acinetobacter baumannii]MCJ9199665.1 hypothetical protein [Acinetobacter baumannii]